MSGKADMTAGPDMPQPDMAQPDMAQPDMAQPDMAQPQALTLTSISPTVGPLAGGTLVTLTGTGFGPGVTVSFGQAQGQSVQVNSSTQLVVTTPQASAPGPVSVEVRAGDRVASLPGAFTFEAPAPPQLSCQLGAQPTLRGEPGQALGPILMQVYLEGVTPGRDQGQGLQVELGYGQGADFSAYTYAAMTYAADKDGPMVGDLAYDEYQASLTISQPGDYRYLARVKAPAVSQDWVYCDTDGSQNGASPDRVGLIELRSPQISFCQLRAQSPVQAKPGMPSAAIYAQVFAQGITEGQGQGAGVEGQLGYGADAANYAAFTYSPMTYDADRDGPNPGDRANDEYGASLTIAAEGSYRYVARFRLSGGEWFYCDLDGHSPSSPFEPAQAGVIEVLADPPPTIAFCQTELAAASTRPGMTTPEITGRVYALGVTDQAGAGAGLTAELVWGPVNTPPAQWTQVIAATYKEDVDGLVPGDLANDRFRAVIQPSAEGDFAYAFRFSLDGGQSHVWCDADGNAPGSFKPDRVGRLTVQANNLPDQCTLQFPNLVTNAPTGSPVGMFGRVFEAGMTDLRDGDPLIRAELVVGPLGADPLTQPMMFTTVPAFFKGPFADKLDEDEYEVQWTPTQAGVYQFFYQFSVDGGLNFIRCDLDGASDAASFNPSGVGVIHVLDTPINAIDYCHVFQTNVTKSLADPMDPVFTVEVYEASVTEANAGANNAQINAELGYGPTGANPGAPGAYTWRAAPYARFIGNNYEYEAPAYAAPPALGLYGVVARVQRAGASQWTYCDNFNGSMQLLYPRISTLSVVP